MIVKVYDHFYQVYDHFENDHRKLNFLEAYEFQSATKHGRNVLNE